MDERTSEALAHARELERRDTEVADALRTVGALAERAGSARRRATETRTSFDAIPDQRQQVALRRTEADAELAAASGSLVEAEVRLEGLRRARRPRAEELARAEKEVETASLALRDAEARVARLDLVARELLAQEKSLRDEGARLAEEATAIAAEVRALPRLDAALARDPGPGLDGIGEWGAQARAALFVARGLLEQERERIVQEANALGSAVLGEPLGGSSVALVRRRLEEHI